MNDHAAAGAPRLLAQGIRKTYGGVVALAGADFDVRPGEVHALLGGNGAGKSTLIKALTGAETPDSGVVHWEGMPVAIGSRADAAALGIRVVYQHSTLASHLSVEENIVLGEERTVLGVVDRADMRRRARAALDDLQVRVDPRALVSALSVGERKLVEIAKALMTDARLLVLDEPTAALGAGDSETLFSAVRDITARGTSVVFITHHLDEILDLSDRVTVMRDGRTIDTVPTASVGKADLVSMMVGGSLPARVADLPDPREQVRLQVSGLASDTGLRDIGFELREGEILGVYGLIGAGRTELARALLGVDRVREGELRVDGVPTRVRSAAAAGRLGISIVPEDRERHGVLSVRSIRENLTIAAGSRIATAGWISARRDRQLAEQTRQKLSIRSSGIEQTVSQLSGGNQQKTVIGRWFVAPTRILLLDDPTVGVDVAARYEIHRLIAELAASGTSVLLATSDLDELFALSPRIMVLRNKRIAGFLPADPDRRRDCFDLAWGA